jgi:DNA helicase II / ATP-dependent DNA helicase PcrA
MFHADLHVHSKYSLATSRECDLERLALWAARKGVAVLGSGDFTHPAWMAEIREKLLPAEPGLFRLRPGIEREIHRDPLWRGSADARFMLQVEIATVYKKNGRTRKLHNLIYAPDLKSARRLTKSLERIGNLHSDGRPILGLDSRDLLEIVLASGDGCFMIPAHVWTPWFGMLGSKSGFDSIEECFEDLNAEIFALETGLSSDPAMNWRLSRLDRFCLVSNSDAHSPQKIAREACAFDADMDYFAMLRALRTGVGYAGTVEFFPQEGKYYFDGHRKCGICLSPRETRRLKGKCPVCGKPVTLGVMNRVCELADRPDAPDPLPPRAARFRSLVPLDQVIGEVLGKGSQTKTVRKVCDELIARVGPELFVLQEAAREDIAKAGSDELAEAILQIRAGRVDCLPGFDGQYGTVRFRGSIP